MPTGSQGGALLPKVPQSFAYLTTIVPGLTAVLQPLAVTYWITAPSAAALTLPVPLATQIGNELIIIAGTAFAHVVTATGLINNGTTGGPHNTWTSAAFVGSAITLQVTPDLKYSMTGQTLGTVA
jgi:hypothetical protein